MREGVRVLTRPGSRSRGGGCLHGGRRRTPAPARMPWSRSGSLPGALRRRISSSRTSRSSGSISRMPPGIAFETQTLPFAAIARPLGSDPAGNSRLEVAGGRIDAGDRPVLAVCDPHGVRARGDGDRLVADVGGSDDAPRPGSIFDSTPAAELRDPDGAVTCRDRVGAGVDVDGRACRPGPGVDPDDGAVDRVCDPDGAQAVRDPRRTVPDRDRRRPPARRSPSGRSRPPFPRGSRQPRRIRRRRRSRMARSKGRSSAARCSSSGRSARRPRDSTTRPTPSRPRSRGVRRRSQRYGGDDAPIRQVEDTEGVTAEPGEACEPPRVREDAATVPAAIATTMAATATVQRRLRLCGGGGATSIFPEGGAGGGDPSCRRRRGEQLTVDRLGLG